MSGVTLSSPARVRYPDEEVRCRLCDKVVTTTVFGDSESAVWYFECPNCGKIQECLGGEF